MSLTNIYRMLRLIIVLISVVVIALCLFYITTYTYPFIFAVMIAFILNPVVNFLEFKLNINRPIAVFLSILFVLAFITGIITILVVELINGTTYLAEQIPTHYQALVIFFQELIAEKIIPIYQQIASMFSTLEENQQDVILQNIQDVGENIASQGALLLQQILQNMPKALGNVSNYVTILIFSLLGTFFISKDWYKLKEMFMKHTPELVNTSTSYIIKELKKALFGFVKAQFTLITITGIIVMIGLVILQVEYAFTIAIITAAIDILPYLGTGLVFIPWIVYSFLSGDYFLTIGLSILYVTVVVQRQLMEPKVLSNNIGLNPLATLIALFVGYQIWGFLGLIIGPVLLVVLNTIHRAGVIHYVWLYIKGDEIKKN
ncbi:sporulation integral membrane protein YtvI [Aquibacillus koreensis]|uniref:Sporulation integral membrane protein YtvI n=1 Tax=Aquibacillus koreensis TaxID=279446 RepID=A0A9X4AGT1_9BACI|nr:sporulation integral membrane protein YtvI [Aquibacillus koreensis]MCT2537182.1 sporulation integral membrane protein YtvI [Aquibacillus koreensis]MDC3419246.1 sporulation integral membrane protein YtvI [Aquibacillus koreensis]